MDFHYVITLSQPVSGGARSATFTGVIEARDDQTRCDLVNDIYQSASCRAGMENANIMFFDLAPNELPAVIQAICY
jgi:hypothetical protein